MDITLFWALFVILGITYFGIAISASGPLESDEDFFFGRRNLGLWALSLSLVGTQLGAGMLLGTAKEAFRFGAYGALYNVGIILGLLVLGLGFAAKLRALKIQTFAQICEMRYGSKILRRLAALLSIITLGGLLVAQMAAAKKILSDAVGPYPWIWFGFWIVVIVYTLIGGFRAVVATQVFQVVIIALILGGVVVWLYLTQGPGFFAFLKPENIGNVHLAFAEWPSQRLFGYLLMPFLYSFIGQEMGQRYFSARSGPIALGSCFLAALFLALIALIPVIFGMKTRLMGLDTELDPFLLFAKSIAQPFFFYIIVCALIAAISSTADALLCAISSNLVLDFDFLPALFKKISMGPFLARFATFVVGLVALIVSSFIHDILSFLIQSYEIYVSCFFVCIIIGIFKTKAHVEAAWLSVIFGFLSYLIFHIIEAPIPREICSLLLSFLGFMGGHFFAKHRKVEI